MKDRLQITLKMKYEDLSLNAQLEAHGIETIRKGKDVYLKHSGKVIERPNAFRCKAVVFRDFGIDMNVDPRIKNEDV